MSGLWNVEISVRQKKLSAQTKRELGSKLSDFDFSCDASLFDLDLPQSHGDVHCRDLRCEDPVEKLYYSMGYEPICTQCSSEDDLDKPEEVLSNLCVMCFY